MTLLGWGVDDQNGEQFWIVQNSWSEKWGEHGFGKVEMKNDPMGIISLAVACDPDFPPSFLIS